MTRRKRRHITGEQKTNAASPEESSGKLQVIDGSREVLLSVLGNGTPRGMKGARWSQGRGQVACSPTIGWSLATLVLASALASSEVAEACTTVLVGKALTADGSVLHAHNEDMGNDAVGRLWYVPGVKHQAGERFRVPYVELERSVQSAGYWASGNAEGGEGLGVAASLRPYDSVLVGLNQHGVSMSCNWAHSRAENREGSGIRRYALRQLLLERATSARHGVEIVGRLIETHGQADWGGLIYHLADPEEAWVVETTTDNWVARRVRDDEIRVTANRFRIGSDYDLSSASLEHDARTNGWLEGEVERVEFGRVYGRPERMSEAYDIRREARVNDLLAPDRGRLTPSHLLIVLRDRYRGTPQFTPPQTEPVWREDLARRPDLVRTIDTNLAQSTFVAHHRGGLPAGVGSVLWYGMGTPSWAGYFPLYSLGGEVPAAYSQREATKQDVSAWWLFRRLQRLADGDYEKTRLMARTVWDDQLAKAMERQSVIEAEVLELLRSNAVGAARKAISEFTASEAERTLGLAGQLLERFAQPPSKRQDTPAAGAHDQ